MSKTKPITITLNLTYEEAINLHEKAARANTTMESLLESFVADLTYSRRSGGSDERDLANEWSERGVGLLPLNTLLSYMLDTDDPKRYLWAACDDKQEAAELLADPDPECHEEGQALLEDAENIIKDCTEFWEPDYTADMDEENQAIQRYVDTLQKIECEFEDEDEDENDD